MPHPLPLPCLLRPPSLQRAQWDPAIYKPDGHATVMDPLILGALLNDLTPLPSPPSLQRAQWDPAIYKPDDHPTIMDPLILGALLNDLGRVAWMVFKCGGNLNGAFVAMPDIPIYFQGQWERMCGRTQSRVMPLHIGVMQKRFETVRGGEAAC